MQTRTWSLCQLKLAVKSNVSLAGVMRALGLKPAGGNYASVRGWIETEGLDTSHFTGQGHNKGKVLPPRRPLEDYTSNKFPIKSCNLKKRLIFEGILEHRCVKCKLTEWLGSPIPLELDHINGDSKDNALKNIRLLCPNCHAQTPTWRGRNISRKSKRH